MKKRIKLVNGEKNKIAFRHTKACDSTSTDICTEKDHASCVIFSFDACEKDYNSCANHSTDNCKVDWY